MLWQHLVNKEKKYKKTKCTRNLLRFGTNLKVPTKEVKFKELPQWLHYFNAVWEIPIYNGSEGFF